MSISKTASAAMMLLLALSLSACGRKGPLYMRPMPVKPESVAHVPYAQKTNNPDLAIQSQPAQTQTESQKQP